ncbi:MAG TPA: hypothetical protein VGS01_11120 [Candidatus Limnocylindria bacterium]|nr:hypothetical protein [Candidatus Limnocylindria bacterium]
MNRFGVTVVWILYLAFTLMSVLVGRSGGGPLSPLVNVWWDNLSFLLGFLGLLTGFPVGSGRLERPTSAMSTR